MTAAQLALLRAALAPPATAAEAFFAWVAIADLDAVSSAEFPLLPLLYQTVEKLELRHPWLPRLAGIYRRTWYANQLMLQHLGRATDALGRAAVPVLFAGAAPLALSVYPAIAARPITTVELLVAPEGVDVALGALQAPGWRASSRRRVDRTWQTRVAFSAGPKQTMELTWHPLPEAPYAAAAAEAWRFPQAHERAGVAVTCLDDTMQLLRLCLAAPLQGPIALADGAMLVMHGAVDWPRLVALAAETRQGPAAAWLLTALRDSLGIVAVPADVVDQLAEQRAPGWATVPWATAAAAAGMRPWQRVAFHYRRFRRLAAAQGRLPGPGAALAYGCTVLDRAGKGAPVIGRKA